MIALFVIGGTESFRDPGNVPKVSVKNSTIEGLDDLLKDEPLPSTFKKLNKPPEKVANSTIDSFSASDDVLSPKDSSPFDKVSYKSSQNFSISSDLENLSADAPEVKMNPSPNNIEIERNFSAPQSSNNPSTTTTGTLPNDNIDNQVSNTESDSLSFLPSFLDPSRKGRNRRFC